MSVENFFFSYFNSLKRAAEKRNFFALFRKAINFFYKFGINFFKKIFLKKFKNLDKNKNVLLYNFSLDNLFKKFNCDKGSCILVDNDQKFYSHNYSIFYEKYLSKFKDKKIDLLEIGSHEGKGLASFFYFFPKANLLGANINPFQMHYSSKRIEEIYIDVSSKVILKNFKKHIKNNFDVIIDDASHNLIDILQTLSILFKKVRNGGFYIIEDIDQFEVFPNLNPNKDKLTPIKILQKIKNNENFETPHLSPKDIDDLKKNIKNIFIEKGYMFLKGKNVSDIVFIEKNDN